MKREPMTCSRGTFRTRVGGGGKTHLLQLGLGGGEALCACEDLDVVARFWSVSLRSVQASAPAVHVN